MNIETFSDGSTIATEETTGNRTVCGKLAHDEYFKRLSAERITAAESPAVMAFCRNVDGTRKAELIRRHTNPLLVATFGEFCWEVWDASDPANITRYASEENARRAFKATMLHGTNGFGV